MINKLKQTDPKLILTAILGLLLAFVAIFFISQKLNLSLPKTVQTAEPAGSSETPTGPVGVTISAVKVDSGTVRLLLTPKSPQSISAFSFRLTYDPSVNPSILPISFTPDDALIAAGWSFPIKKITTEDNGLVTIDISGLYISPTGFNLGSAVTVGSINFTPNSENLSLTTTLVRSETKILEKSSSELNYDFSTK